MSASSWARAALAAAALAAAAGCNSGPVPYPVAGQVVFDDGKPATELAGWEVTFTSAELKASSGGPVGPDGRFVLNYLKAGDGALPGTYKVVIVLPGVTGLAEVVEEDENNPGRAKRSARRKGPLPAKYSNLGQTPLTAVVEPKTNDITLTVSRR